MFYRCVPLHDTCAALVNGDCRIEGDVYDNLWDKSELYAKVKIVHEMTKEKNEWIV